MTKAEFTARRESRRRPKGYAPWAPHKPTLLLLEQVRAVLDEYEDHLPLTVRQIFYRLVASYGYPKTENGCGRLGEHLVRARRAGMIPFEYIRDDGIVSYSSRWHEGVGDFWDETGRRLRAYRRDRQAGQAVRLELWCEAAGMAPQLARVADDCSVPVFSTGGFGSLTAVRLIADRALARTTPTVLLHVGDLDPSGESIFTAMTADAAAFVEADRLVHTLRIVPRRVALTPDQVVRYRLPTAYAKASDSRSRRWHGETCQLEALAPDLLAGIVENAIKTELDLGLLERQVAREHADKVEILRALPPGTGSASS